MSSSLQALITNPSCRSPARQLKGEVTSFFIVNRFCCIPFFFQLVYSYIISYTVINQVILYLLTF